MKLKVLLRLLLLLVTTGAAFYIYEYKKFDAFTTSIHQSNMKIPINSEAPVISNDEIVIDAPVGKVWEVLTNINDWPQWQSEVTQATISGALKEGTQFKWKAGGLSFNSQIHTMKEHDMFGWTGTTFGASAVHNWTFTRQNGKTIVQVEESLQGVFPSLFSGFFKKSLDKGMRKSLEELKEASEK